MCEMKPDWAGIWEEGNRKWMNEMIIEHGSLSKAWDKGAEGYKEFEDDLKYSNYLAPIKKVLLSKPETVLDIGAGTGIFAIPLAKKVKNVVVIEPSQVTLDLLKEKVGADNLTNIKSLCVRWEEVSEKELMELNKGKFDAVLSFHSLGGIADTIQSLRKMNDVCSGFVYLLVGSSEYNQCPDYKNLYLQLFKKLPLSIPDYACIYMILREMGIETNIEMVDFCMEKPVASIDELVDEWVRYRLMRKKVTKTQKIKVKNYLSEKIKEMKIKGDGLYFEHRYKSALIYWKVGEER